MADRQELERQEELRLRREKRRRYEQRRRAHIRKQILVFGGGGLVILLLLFLLLRGCTREKQEISQIRSTANLRPLPDISREAEELNLNQPDEQQGRVITLAAVGDIMCYDEQIRDAVSGMGYDFNPAFSEVAGVLSEADLAVGNLETTFADGVDYQGKPDFNSPPELANALAAAGFDVLSTANTYSIQHGVNGLYSTRLHVQQAGMDPVGTYYTREERTNGGAVIREVGGVKVAFLAYTKGVNNMYLPDGYEYCVNLLYNDYYYAYTGFRRTDILADVAAAKEAGAEVIVCLLHWGSEYESEVSDSQKEIANALISAGVNVILGAHSHVLGEVELRQFTDSSGQERQALIAWSLGNFFSYMTRDGTMESAILQMAIRLDEKGNVTFDSVDYVPVCTSYDHDSDFRVTNIPLQIDKYLSVAEGAVDAAAYERLQETAKRIARRIGDQYQPPEAAAQPAQADAAPEGGTDPN